MPDLHAWTAPVHGPLGRLLDHTWITSQPTVINRQSSRDYWYCAGAFRGTTGASRIATRTANLRLARCLDTPNVYRGMYVGLPSADLAYLIDGVCHQIANRILIATTPRLTVAGVPGYLASWITYGTYGYRTQDWEALVKERCGIAGRFMQEETLKEVLAARTKKPLDPKTLEELALLREEERTSHEQLMRAYVGGNISSKEYTATRIERSAILLQKLEQLLGPEYETIVGFAPGERVDLVDPNLPAYDDGRR